MKQPERSRRLPESGKKKKESGINRESLNRRQKKKD
jgi:hypothetical protein